MGEGLTCILLSACAKTDILEASKRDAQQLFHKMVIACKFKTDYLKYEICTCYADIKAVKYQSPCNTFFSIRLACAIASIAAGVFERSFKKTNACMVLR